MANEYYKVDEVLALFLMGGPTAQTEGDKRRNWTSVLYNVKLGSSNALYSRDVLVAYRDNWKDLTYWVYDGEEREVWFNRKKIMVTQALAGRNFFAVDEDSARLYLHRIQTEEGDLTAFKAYKGSTSQDQNTATLSGGRSGTGTERTSTPSIPTYTSEPDPLDNLSGLFSTESYTPSPS